MEAMNPIPAAIDAAYRKHIQAMEDAIAKAILIAPPSTLYIVSKPDGSKEIRSGTYPGIELTPLKDEPSRNIDQFDYHDPTLRSVGIEPFPPDPQAGLDADRSYSFTVEFTPEPTQAEKDAAWLRDVLESAGDDEARFREDFRSIAPKADAEMQARIDGRAHYFSDPRGERPPTQHSPGTPAHLMPRRMRTPEEAQHRARRHAEGLDIVASPVAEWLAPGAVRQPDHDLDNELIAGKARAHLSPDAYDAAEKFARSLGCHVADVVDESGQVRNFDEQELQ